jgi:SAM-dependent methyltransferase
MLRDDPTRFRGSIPDYYDKGLGPVIFAEPADVAARRVASKAPARVLETAAGTGIVTRRMRDALPATADIVATDLNADMLEISRTKFRPDENVTLQVADATALPFADGEFDAVLCQFGVMFFPDKDKAYREVHRVLAAGGHYVFTVWDTLEHNAFGRIAAHAMRNAFNADPPPFMSVPFGYAAIDPIKTSLLANGFHSLRIDLVQTQGAIADFDRFADGLVHGSPLADQIRSRGGEPEKLQRAMAQSLRDEFGETKSAPLQFILFDARRA